MTNLSLHPYPYCSRILLIQGLFQTLGRSQILCLFTKSSKQIVDIIDQSPCYLFLENSLKESFSVQFLSILKRIIYFVLIRLSSDLLILMNTNFSQYCLKFIYLLIAIHQRCLGYFLRSFKII